MCGAELARCHARSGDAGRDRGLRRQVGLASTGALAAFAEAYADQNERDYAALQEAVASGRVAAEMGV